MILVQEKEEIRVKSWLVVDLDADLLGHLESVARELGVPKEHLLEEALDHYFEYLDIRLADRRMEDLLSGRSKLIPFEEVIAELKG